MATSVVVELTPDEERLLNAFRKIEAADAKMRADFEKSATTVESAGDRIVDAMVKAGKNVNASLDQSIANLKRTGETGKKVGGDLEQYLLQFGLAGRKTFQEVAAEFDRFGDDISNKVKQLTADWEAADRKKKFEETNRQLESLGGEFETLSKKIKEATKVDGSVTAEAQRLVASLREIDPAAAERISAAMRATQEALREQSIEQMVASLKDGDKASKSLAEALSSKVKAAAFEAAGGVDLIAKRLVSLNPELEAVIDKWRTEWAAADQQTRFDNTKKELADLGGRWAKLANEIDLALATPMQGVAEKARQVVDELSLIDPSKAQAIADAIERVEKSTRESDLKDLVTLLGQGSQQARELSQVIGTSLKDAAFEARGGIEAIANEIIALRPEMASLVDKWRTDWAAADQQNKFNGTKKDLADLGGQWAKLATEIDLALSTPMQGAAARAREIVAELSSIDPSKAQAIADAMDRVEKSTQESNLRDMVAMLGQGSQQARELSQLLGAGIQSAALEAEGGIEGITNRILAMRPELATTVEQWRANMAEAARFSEGQFEQVLNTLRRADPVSRQVADAIRAHLVEAGQIVERSFEDMIRPLEQIDPAVAEHARRMRQQFEDAGNEGENAFTRLGGTAKTELAGVIASYVGVQEAIQFVTDKIREQQEVLREAAGAHKTLAVAQQEAAKSLSTLPDEQKNFILTQAVQSISKQSNFADLSAITSAFGEAASAGATYEQMLNIIPAAAAISGNTPDQLPTLSSSILDSMKATGIQDAKQNMSLALIAGAESRVADPLKTVRNMAPVQVAGSNQAGTAGALEGMALFAALSNAGADWQGDSTQTASIQFIGKMDSFFKGLEAEREKAQKKLDDHKKVDPLTETSRLRYEKLQSDKKNKAATDASVLKTEAEIDTIDQQLQVARLPTGARKSLEVKKRELKEKLTELKKSQFGEKEDAELADIESRVKAKNEAYEKKRSELQAEVDKTKIKGLQGPIPKLPSQQLAILQQDETLKKQFLEDPFGEQRFRPGFEQLLNRGKAFEDFQKTLSIVKRNQGSTELYDKQVEFDKSGTPQMAEAYNQRGAEAAKNRRNAFDSMGANAGSIRDELAAALRASRPEGAAGIAYAADDALKGTFLLGGMSGAEENYSAINILTRRMKQIESGGITAREQPGYEQVKSTIDVAMNRLASPLMMQESPDVIRGLAGQASQKVADIQAGKGTESEQRNIDVFLRLEKILAEQVRLQQEMLKQSQTTAQNTKPQPPRNGDAQAAAANQALNKGRGQ